MVSVNIVIMVGRLGKDPEMRYTPSGKAITNFTIAVNMDYKKDSEWIKQTEWVNVVCWGRTAEYASQKLSKGSLVYVQGKLQSRSWDKQDGTKAYRTELIADRVMPLEKNESQQAESEVESEDLPF